MYNISYRLSKATINLVLVNQTTFDLKLDYFKNSKTNHKETHPLNKPHTHTP